MVDSSGAYTSVATKAATPGTYTPQFINWGGIGANVGATAVQPGASQLANNVGTAANLASAGSKLYQWMNGSGTAVSAATGGAGSISSEVAQGLGTSGSESLGISGLNTASGGLNFLDGGEFTGTASDLAGFGSSAGSVASNFGTTGADALGALGGLGTGFGIGGLNLFHGNATGSSIGGALGGGLGSWALGGLTTGLGAAVSGAIGGELGATIGSVIPGIGTIVGALAGSALGGLIGGPKPHPVSESAFSGVGSDGTLNDLAYGSKHIPTDVAKKGANDFQTYLQDQSKKYGITYAPGVLGRVDYTDKIGKIALSDDPDVNTVYHASQANKSNDKASVFSFTDQASQTKAYQDAFNYLATKSGYDPTKLTAVAQPGEAGSVVIPHSTEPSDWDKFLAAYKTSHGQ